MPSCLSATRQTDRLAGHLIMIERQGDWVATLKQSCYLGYHDSLPAQLFLIPQPPGCQLT